MVFGCNIIDAVPVTRSSTKAIALLNVVETNVLKASVAEVSVCCLGVDGLELYTESLFSFMIIIIIIIINFPQ